MLGCRSDERKVDGAIANGVRSGARLRATIAWLLIAAAAPGVFAADPPAPEPAPPPPPVTEPVPAAPPDADAATEPPRSEAAPAEAAQDTGVLGTTRRSLRSTTEWLARGIDRWFGDKPFEEGGEVTRGRFGIDLLWREREGVDTNVRFDARVRLPNVERRAYVFIGRDDEREVVTDKPGDLSGRERLLEQARDDQSFFAGIAVPLKRLFEFRIGIRAREKIFAQVRYRHLWQLGERGRIDFRETVFWTLDDRFGSTTSLSYDLEFSPGFAFRWANSTTISQRSKRFEWSSTPGLYKSFFDGSHILSLQAPVTGAEGTGVPVSEYGLQVKWQQPVYRDYLIGEVLTGHYWPREDASSPRGERWAVGAGLKLLF